MTPNDVMAIARNLFRTPRRRPLLGEVDGRFLLEVYDLDWIDLVTRCRERLSATLERDLPTREQRSSELIESMDGPTRQYVEDWTIQRCRETDLDRKDIVEHLLCGYGITLPRFSVVVGGNGAVIPRFPWANPRIVVMVYSDDVSPGEVQKHFRNTIATAPWMFTLSGEEGNPHFTRSIKRVRRHDTRFMTRTWTVLCLTQRARLSVGAAIDLWNQEFPHLAYGNADHSNQPAPEFPDQSVTTSPMVQFSRDKSALLRRLRLIDNAA